MIKYALVCDKGHDFESWFPNSDAYDKQVKRGLVASGGGLLRLPRRIPRNVATEAVLTGRPLSAARCAELGLVNAVVADGEALDAALALAGDIAANAPLALVASKQVMADSALWTDDEQFARQEALVAPVRASPDVRTGATTAS